MLPTNNIKRFITCFLMVILAYTVQAQTTQPTWWFGVSGAANFNFYDGTTQQLNNSLIVPAAFHKGFGVRPYGSVLTEYRPAGVWGGMLNVGYDGRGGEFKDVIAPCNCLATLQTNTSYIVVEPSLRLAAGSSKLYFFAGPSLAFNIARDFTYTQLRQPDISSQLSEMRKTLISGQVGAGYEIPLSSKNSTTKVNLSPFISYHPYFGRAPRNIESWQITTVRVGVALKFGKGKRTAAKESVMAVVPTHEVSFVVRAPKNVPLKRQVSETLPLLNSIFFNEGSTEIPTRYAILTKDQASGFKEEQLQNEQTQNMTGRSGRQLNIYYNILNILGDRMRSNPAITITLNGASTQGLQDGKAFAESVKQYLVSVFGISGSRITTTSRIKPINPSEQPGGNKELTLLRAEDRRVDIESTSPGLLMEVGGGMMNSVQFLATQVDPLDSHVVFQVDSASELLKSWSINVTDENGTVQHYGPFTRNQESVSGASILGNNPTGDYKIEMVGETNNGLTVKKQGTVHLIRQEQALEKGYRYSIVFDFDRSKTIASYDKFLTVIVSPLITDGSTVIIHGHTDIIGDAEYNQKLSDSRAQQTQKIIEKALSKAGKNNVKFETFGFGEDLSHSPFENNLPEERFYNRTVVIDIITVK
ncbi:MAG: outer membrane protein OmpA [Mucilaginibacter sp.]|nr:outer membrane protein OmpA [Mucilaginibacter sp.]